MRSQRLFPLLAAWLVAFPAVGRAETLALSKTFSINLQLLGGIWIP